MKKGSSLSLICTILMGRVWGWHLISYASIPKKWLKSIICVFCAVIWCDTIHLTLTYCVLSARNFSVANVVSLLFIRRNRHCSWETFCEMAYLYPSRLVGLMGPTSTVCTSSWGSVAFTSVFLFVLLVNFPWCADTTVYLVPCSCPVPHLVILIHHLHYNVPKSHAMLDITS